MILTLPEDLARMPGKRRTVKGDEHEARLGTRDEQRSVIQAQPRPSLPRRDVHNRKTWDQAPACGDEAMRCVLVSQYRVRCGFLLHAIC